jgi:glyoxylase-like metal-dependent hydrolase (beta-lactamase superfamily II)
MRIIPLSEGAFTIDTSKLFVPFDMARDDLQQRATGSLLVEVQPFVVVTADDVLLLDTGLGFEKDGGLQIHGLLLSAGIQPEAVTKILVSHLHKDHAGGISRVNPADGRRSLSFPRATYYLQRQELDFAFSKGFPSYLTGELEGLKNEQRVVLLDGDTVLDGYIRCQLTGAHCPFHQVFWIVDGGETAFFGGDVAPQLQQMKNRFVAKYDYDGKKCMELRRSWWDKGREEKWIFLFYHDIGSPVYSNG